MLALLNHYYANRDVESLGRGLYMLLESPIDRRILPDVRYVCYMYSGTSV